MESKGSITVFMSLTILMCMALIFSLVEVIHFTGVKDSIDTISKIGIESAFGEYNRLLWEDYRLLAIDGGYGTSAMNTDKLEKRVAQYVNDNLNPENDVLISYSNFMRTAINDVNLSQYGLISDGQGKAVIKEAAAMAIDMIATYVWGSIEETFGDGDVKLDENTVEELLKETRTQVETASENRDTESDEYAEAETVELPDDFVNPIDAALEWKSQAVLSQVIPDMSSLSTKHLATGQKPSTRSLNTGNVDVPSISNSDKLMFTQYLRNHFDSFRNASGHGGISYEWEYIVSGKDSDTESLEAVVIKLLALREVQNLTSIYKDGVKVSEAESIAAAISAALMLPALIEPIKVAIIAAWAYLESVLDVRLLLQGGKLSLIKSPSEWTSQILAFPNYLNASITAKECEAGLSYEDYLAMLTLIMSENQLGLRTLDVLEDALNAGEDYAGVKIDNFVYCGQMEFDYHATPIFATIIPMLGNTLDAYHFNRKEDMSYI